MSRVLVTGAGSGFGLALCRRLLARGDDVVATDLSEVGLADLVSRGVDVRGTLQVAALDLRGPGTIDAAVRAAGSIDVLVNNAGYAYFAAMGEGDMDAFGALLDANVLGTARVTKAALPALRASGGLIVQISSIAGRVVFPESGFYAACKHAIEAMSEALWLENRGFGVRVAVVEPGAFATGFAARAASVSGPRPTAGAYAGIRPTWDAVKTASLSAPQDPERVVDAIVAAIDGDVGFQRFVVGDDATALASARDASGGDAFVQGYGAKLDAPDVERAG